MNSLQVKLAEKISTIAPAVEADVIDALVNRELTKRSTAVVQAMDALGKLEGEMNKVRPDKTFDSKGEVISEFFTKVKLEEKNKLQQKIDRHTKAITKALEKGDFGDVYNLKSGDNQKSGGDETPAEAV